MSGDARKPRKTLPKLSFENYYTLFGIETTFNDPKVLDKAYRNLARKYHPDRNEAEDATDVFQSIRKAFEILSDGNERAAYDRTIKAKIQRQEKIQKMDKKRSRMKEDLEARERQFKKRKMEEQQRKYAKEAAKSRFSTQGDYDNHIIQQAIQEVRARQQRESLNFFQDFIVLQWNPEQGTYSKDNLISLFSSFGSVADVVFVDAYLALLLFRNEPSAIKLMYSVQEGKQFGNPTNRIQIRWADRKADDSHFHAAPASEPTKPSKPEPTRRPNDPSHSIKIPSLEEHLKFEKTILDLLLKKVKLAER